MLNRKKYVLSCATSSLCVWAVAHVGGQAPQQSRPQGWAVRQSLNNPNAPLYNNVKQKLLDGKQVTTFAINRPDTKLYCEAAKHYDYIWFEMQHSTMSFKDIEEMIAACPRPIATPVIRVPDEAEGNIQKATDIGALGVVIPTVDTPEKAMLAARYARYPPDGRRSVGAGQATSIWGGNGVNYNAPKIRRYFNRLHALYQGEICHDLDAQPRDPGDLSQNLKANGCPAHGVVIADGLVVGGKCPDGSAPEMAGGEQSCIYKPSELSEGTFEQLAPGVRLAYEMTEAIRNVDVIMMLRGLRSA